MEGRVFRKLKRKKDPNRFSRSIRFRHPTTTAVTETSGVTLRTGDEVGVTPLRATRRQRGLVRGLVPEPDKVVVGACTTSYEFTQWSPWFYPE